MYWTLQTMIRQSWTSTLPSSSSHEAEAGTGAETSLGVVVVVGRPAARSDHSVAGSAVRRGTRAAGLGTAAYAAQPRLGEKWRDRAQ